MSCFQGKKSFSMSFRPTQIVSDIVQINALGDDIQVDFYLTDEWVVRKMSMRELWNKVF